jgi:hypothetical protein
MAKYKVTGKFCVLNGKGEVLESEFFINKIIEAKNTRKAKDSAIGFMVKKLSKKYSTEIILRQISSVVVKHHI